MNHTNSPPTHAPWPVISKCNHDHVPLPPPNLLPFRLKILQNIGTVFVKMGQYGDAITSFEHIMEEKPEFKAGWNKTTEQLHVRNK